MTEDLNTLEGLREVLYKRDSEIRSLQIQLEQVITINNNLKIDIDRQDKLMKRLRKAGKAK